MNIVLQFIVVVIIAFILIFAMATVGMWYTEEKPYLKMTSRLSPKLLSILKWIGIILAAGCFISMFGFAGRTSIGFIYLLLLAAVLGAAVWIAAAEELAIRRYQKTL